MPIPDYQAFMLPILQFSADDHEHTLAEVSEKAANQFNLSESDRAEKLSSGILKLSSRVGWAKTYLVKAGLLLIVSRGKFKITERGKKLLRSKPGRIDVAALSQFPEFLEFKNAGQESKSSHLPALDNHTGVAEQTPQELLESSFQTIRRKTAGDLLEKIGSATPSFFEKLVVDLLVAMGYGGSREDAGRVIGKSGDDGIDGIIKEDRLGLESVYVQAKRWKGVVGRPDIQAFAGSLEGQRARKGVFITTSKFSAEAEDYVKRIEKRIVLINGETLANLSIEFGIGVEKVNTYIIHRLDTDYFEEE